MLKRVVSMACKDLKILSRDKMGAFFIIGFPILMGLFFGLVMGNPGSSQGKAKMAIAIVDQDQSKMSQRFVQAMEANDSVLIESAELDQAKESVRKGQRSAVIVIDEGFGETAGLFWETPPTIQIGADPSKMAESAMLQGFVMEAIGQLAGDRFQDLSEMTSFVEKSRNELAADKNMSTGTRIAMQAFLGSIESLASNIDTLQQQSEDAQGGEADAGGRGFNFVNIESMDVRKKVDPNSVLGQMQKSKSQWDISFPQAMMWGVLGCVAGFSISIAKENSMGTMTRLQVAPVSQMEILLGKALACFLAVVVVVAMMTGLGIALGMKPDNFLLLAVAAFCVAVCFVGIMMVMSLLGKTEQSVSGAGWAINMVMAMFGGCMIPVMFMPGFMQSLSFLSPIRWSILVLEGAIWREFSFAEMAFPCFVLLAVGVVGFTIGTFMLRRANR